MSLLAVAIKEEAPENLLAKVQSLLSAGTVDVNERESWGRSALVILLWRTISPGDLPYPLPIVSALLVAGADVCSPGKKSIHCALFLAGDPRAPKELLTHLVDHLQRHSIVCQCVPSPLHRAMLSGNLANIKLLLGHGSGGDSTNNPVVSLKLNEALGSAVRRKYVEISKLLIDRGASVNCCDDYNRSLLHIVFLSTFSGAFYPMVEFLIAHGINVWRLSNGGGTALHRLCDNLHYRDAPRLQRDADCGKCASLLLDAAEKQRNSEEAKATQGKNSCASFIDLVDDDGYTALHYAVFAQNLGSIRVLLDHGADFSIKADEGTALDFARDRHPDAHSVFVQFEYVQAMRSFLLCHRIARRHVVNKAGGRRRSGSSTDETSDSVLSCLPDLPASMIAQFMLPNELRKKEYRDREL